MINLRLFTSVALLISGPITGAFAAAPYCALRDPTPQIYELFPEANSYSSEVHSVDSTVRDRVAQSLPFTLHERELGRHTIYLPMQDGQAAGIVHVRSEASEWGLIEVIWALNPAMKVRGFSLQRCRGGSCKQLQTKEFEAALVGRGVDELAELLNDDQSTLAVELPGLDDEGRALAATVIRSGMKTIAVTGIVGSEDQQASLQPDF